MKPNQEKITKLAWEAIHQLAMPEGENYSVAAIEWKPRYCLANRIIDALADAKGPIKQVELYENGDPDSTYIRAYEKASQTGVVSYVVGNKVTIDNFAKWGTFNPTKVTGNEPWFVQVQELNELSRFLTISKLFFKIRYCSFVLESIDLIESAIFGTLRIKKYALAFKRILEGEEIVAETVEHFTHVTRPDERMPIKDAGHGAVFSNSPKYLKDNPQYPWRPLGKLMTSRVQSKHGR